VEEISFIEEQKKALLAEKLNKRLLCSTVPC